MKHVRRHVSFSLILLVISSALSAASIPVGYLSFDLLIPADQGNPGVNAFTIANLTGDPGTGGFALPPDFPVLTELTFLNASLTLFGTGAPSVIPLGIVGPGFFSPASLQFADMEQFTSARFTATLSPTNLQLDGGGSFNASSSVSATLSPAFGDFLSPGLDIALIEANEAGLADVPEPSAYTLFALGLACLSLIPRRS